MLCAVAVCGDAQSFVAVPRDVNRARAISDFRMCGIASCRVLPFCAGDVCAVEAGCLCRPFYALYLFAETMYRFLFPIIVFHLSCCILRGVRVRASCAPLPPTCAPAVMSLGDCRDVTESRCVAGCACMYVLLVGLFSLILFLGTALLVSV